MNLEQQLAALAPLADPVRRRLYLYVAARGGEVSRDEAARALGIARPLAVFHLDKLVEYGLIEALYRRLNRRSGPGAGRPAKLYRRAQHSFSVSLPQRQYELAGQLLLATVMENSHSAPATLRRRAAALGKRIGREWKAEHAISRETANEIEQALARWGYEPCREGRDIKLRNCPFEGLARQCPPVVCHMNLSLLRGLLRGLNIQEFTAKLQPQPGACCVALRGRTSERRRQTA